MSQKLVINTEDELHQLIGILEEDSEQLAELISDKELDQAADFIVQMQEKLHSGISFLKSQEGIVAAQEDTITKAIVASSSTVSQEGEE